MVHFIDLGEFMTLSLPNRLYLGVCQILLSFHWNSLYTEAISRRLIYHVGCLGRNVNNCLRCENRHFHPFSHPLDNDVLFSQFQSDLNNFCFYLLSKKYRHADWKADLLNLQTSSCHSISIWILGNLSTFIGYFWPI